MPSEKIATVQHFCASGKQRANSCQEQYSKSVLSETHYSGVHRSVGPVPEGYERMVRQMGEAWSMCSGGQFYEQITESLLLLCL
jgi:hypothetical protein